MIEKLQAVGIFVVVKRDVPESEKNGFVIPDIAKRKPSTGLILTVGRLVKDKAIKKGKKAVFNSGAGFPLELGGEEVTVLNDQQIIAVV